MTKIYDFDTLYGGKICQLAFEMDPGLPAGLRGLTTDERLEAVLATALACNLEIEVKLHGGSDYIEAVNIPRGTRANVASLSYDVVKRTMTVMIMGESGPYWTGSAALQSIILCAINSGLLLSYVDADPSTGELRRAKVNTKQPHHAAVVNSGRVDDRSDGLLCVDFMSYPDGHTFNTSFKLANFFFKSAAAPRTHLQDGEMGLTFDNSGLDIDTSIAVSSVMLRIGAYNDDVEVEVIDGAGGVQSQTIPAGQPFQTVNFASAGIHRICLRGGGNEGSISSICIPLPR